VTSASAGEIERIAARLDDGANLFRLEHRRRAAAEENGVGRDAAGAQSDLAAHRLDVAVLQLGLKETTIEVAVVADGGAERDVDVESEHF
jgi:hypothetical protein